VTASSIPGRHLGPQRFDNGPARASQEALDREAVAYAAQVEAGTLPCECPGDETMIPFQSPAR
jgi:hypothetical protein